VTRVEFRISGNGLTDVVIGVATNTIYGWLYRWDTAPFDNGQFPLYELTAVAYNAIGNARSAPLKFYIGVFPGGWW
jgi:hypothetical protein